MAPPLVVRHVADPERSEHWPEFKAFLEPARVRGGCDTLIGPNEVLWAVLDGNKAIGAATARLLVDDTAEVVLVGGVRHREWIKELDDRIGAAAAEAGATHLRAYGRRGWLKSLCANGWERKGQRDGFVAYERELRH